LSKAIEAGNMPPDQTSLSKFIGRFIHRGHIASGMGHIFGNNVNVTFLLDQMFSHPGGVHIRLEYHGKGPDGGDNAETTRSIGLSRDLVDLKPPAIAAYPSCLKKSLLGMTRVEILPPAFIGFISDDPLNRVQAKVVKEILVDPSMYVLRNDGITW
jgi:hypothetical protein